MTNSLPLDGKSLKENKTSIIYCFRCGKEYDLSEVMAKLFHENHQQEYFIPMNKSLKEEIEIVLIRMMPAAPSFPTALLQDQDREARLAAIEKARNKITFLILESMPEWMPKRKSIKRMKEFDNLINTLNSSREGFNEALSQTEKNFREFCGAYHGCDPRYCEACKRGTCGYCYFQEEGK